MTAVSPAFWNPQAHMPTVMDRQVVIERGEGAYVYTQDGQRLFDGSAALWYANVGHGRAEIAEVAAEQMRKLETYHTFGRYVNDQAQALSERLRELAPMADAKVILNAGGSDAVDVACKLARRYWQVEGAPAKKIILSRESAYHGLHAYGTSVGGLDFNREGYGTESLIPETARVSRDDIEAVEAEILRIGPENIAAFISEPIMGTGGVHPPAPGYLEGLQRLAAEHDFLLIADEVITGFGRTGQMFASQRYNLSPDIVTMAKGITSGYAPLGGILVAPRVWEPFFTRGAESPVYRHGTTYSGHATSCAVAMKNLDILEAEHLVQRAKELETVLAEATTVLEGHALVRDIRVGGFLAGIELDPAISGEALADTLIERGFIFRPLPGNNLQMSPPFVTTDSEVHTAVKAIKDALDTAA